MTSRWAPWLLKYRHLDGLLNRSFRCKWKKISKLLSHSPLWGELTEEFPSPRASNQWHGKYLSSAAVRICLTLQWRHNDRDCVSNHQPNYCLLNRFFRRRSKKTSKLRVTGLCAGHSPVTGEFPAQRASTAENVSIWWRHYDYMAPEWWPLVCKIC